MKIFNRIMKFIVKHTIYFFIALLFINCFSYLLGLDFRLLLGIYLMVELSSELQKAMNVWEKK